jgi:uncharacterized protein (TIGR03437 family)
MRMTCSVLLLLPGLAFSRTVQSVTFEPNAGQTDARVKYLGHTGGSTVWLTERGATLGLNQKSGQAVLKLRFEGAAHAPQISGEEPLPGVSNYFLGRDPSRWRTNVKQFGKVRYWDVYPGIDIVFYGDPQQLEYDFVLRPGADASKILLAFDGADRMELEPAGDLVLEISGMEIRNRRPKIYQQDGKLVKGRFVVRGKRRAGFAIDSYDATQTLVVDPVMTYGSYVGGSGGDYALALAADRQGNLYLAGSTNSPNFPTKAGLGNSYTSKFPVAFITKINPSMSGALSLIYSSYLGGTNEDHAEAVTVDASGNAYLAGSTFSTDFPLKNAFQGTISTALNCRQMGNAAVCGHGFVSKISTDGATLVYSSFLGGSNEDDPYAIAVDASGGAYVAGQTRSVDFPTRGTPYQTSLNGSSDGFIARISPDGGALAYSTFFGGEGDDWFNSISLDSAGAAYLAGGTLSTHLPVSSNAFQMNLSGNTAALVVKFNTASGGAAGLIYSTYLGGTGGDSNALGVAPDANGNVYITGGTTSPNFPVSAGAFQSKYGGALSNDSNAGFLATGAGDAFVTQLTLATQGTAQLAYSTYIGGAGNEQGSAIAVTRGGLITVVGGTDSQGFFTTPNAFQPFPYFPAGVLKGFVVQIDPSQAGAASIPYASLLGGSSTDIVYGVTIDATGSLVSVAGETFSRDIPVSPSAFQSKYGGSDGTDGDAFVARFDLSGQGPFIGSRGNRYVFASTNFAPTGLSPGLNFSLGGTGLGPDVLQGPLLDANRKVATTIAGVQVLVNGTPAPLIHVSATQIDAVAPYAIAGAVGSTVNVQVINNGVGSNIPNAQVVATAPGIYSLGNNQGAIVNQDGSVNGPNNPAVKGSIISIFATGEGQLNPPGVDGQLEFGPTLPKPVAAVSVTIGGLNAPVTYAGTAPQSFDGFLQVNATIPANAPSGAIPVVLIVGGNSSAPQNVVVR